MKSINASSLTETAILRTKELEIASGLSDKWVNELINTSLRSIMAQKQRKKSIHPCFPVVTGVSRNDTEP